MITGKFQYLHLTPLKSMYRIFHKNVLCNFDYVTVSVMLLNANLTGAKAVNKIAVTKTKKKKKKSIKCLSQKWL